MAEQAYPSQTDLRGRIQGSLSRSTEWARDGLSLLSARAERWREKARLHRRLAHYQRDLRKARTDLGRRLMAVHRPCVEEVGAVDSAVRGLMDRIDRLEAEVSETTQTLRELQSEGWLGQEEGSD